MTPLKVKNRGKKLCKLESTKELLKSVFFIIILFWLYPNVFEILLNKFLNVAKIRKYFVSDFDARGTTDRQSQSTIKSYL